MLHIVGHSGSGKTTFITRLVIELQKIGTVATIKHLGHHRYEVPEGKDTTLFFESGVNCSEGIDNEKSVILLRDPDLLHALYRLADFGMDFAIIEGFKSIEIPGIVFGNLPVPDPLMKDPTIEQVIRNLRIFPEVHTKCDQERKIKAEWSEYSSVPPDCMQCDKDYKTCQGYKAGPRESEKNAGDNRGVVLSLTVGICFAGGIEDRKHEQLVEITGNIDRERIIAENRVLASVVVRNRLIPPGPEEIYITAISSGYRQGIVAISQICRELKENVTPLGATLSGID
ncbi:MAG: molybdopterin-guanine dinucleotide biosynthesis protein B [Methanoregulaceae archaeon]|nr:molybdopterin-guanine dinucleotide biosynthesis protein B [Methanoregulaceae archaeon]